MKGSAMKSFLTVLFSTLFFSLVLIQCGSDPVVDGDEAFAEGKYGQAITYYLEAKKAQPDNPLISEKIALTYMQRGLNFFQKRKNINAFKQNFETGMDNIPEKPTAEFAKEFSKLLYELAMAYSNTKAENKIQEEQYFNLTLENLEEAIYQDEANEPARTSLAEIKKANFQQMFKKGMTFFQQAKKEKNNDLYLAAERNLRKAVSFNEESLEAKKQLKAVRRKTLSIVNMDEMVPFAVADYSYKGKFILVAFTAINNSGAQHQFDPLKIKIVGMDENEYAIDKTQTAKYDDGITKAVSLGIQKRLDGTLAFAVSRKIKINYIKYEFTEGENIIKYFP